MHKTMKRIAAGLVAITAGLSAAAASAPMSAFAEYEEILVRSDFEAGIGLPWYTWEAGLRHFRRHLQYNDTE